MARSMLHERGLPKYFWAEAVNTACYVVNRVTVRSILKKTPYELWKGRKPNISHLRVFGCKCFVLNNGKDDLGKFDSKSDEAIFLGYSSTSKAYRVYNTRSMLVEESIHVDFDESNANSPKRDDDPIEGIGLEKLSLEGGETKAKEESHHEGVHTHRKEESVNELNLPLEWKYKKAHPPKLIIGDPSQGVRTRASFQDEVTHSAFISQIEPKSFEEAEKDEFWILAMQEELEQFSRNDV
ncbi:Retrovirus-related Pol polyprotein from transposon TNT 1-94 [Apostasia shenzhenica]|uniref:Retrovirus-related Pol polyprotein from transposon TNT 1-94 n=1 Tax=Apostasia shenzhenica TaxID=1088818 RepID=A0A2I0B6A1_9ASPA|nr:Retrovirus-related Pol polyprotein from transposon TNT 1-94 [Apostasia shenzhenica]